MGRPYDHNEFGIKSKVEVKLDGVIMERQFRSEGHAREYLRKEGYSKEEIARRVKFLRS